VCYKYDRINSTKIGRRKAMLEIKNLSVRYPRTEINRIKGLTITVSPGETVTVIGPSGAGKTTLLKVIAGIISATEGSVFFEGRDLSVVHPADRKIGYVPQTGGLLPFETAAGNIAFPLTNRRSKEVKQRVMEVMDMLGIGDLADEYPSVISGGQRQRVSIARALVKKPRLLLFDEPLASLDAIRRRAVRKEFASLFSRLNCTVLYVTHDTKEAIELGSRIAVINDGEIVQIGTISELREKPASGIVTELLED